MDEVHASHDRIADVLYISVGTPDRRARSASDNRGLIWRTLPDGRCVGLTVENFASWHDKTGELRALIRQRMPEVASAVSEIA